MKVIMTISEIEQMISKQLGIDTVELTISDMAPVECAITEDNHEALTFAPLVHTIDPEAPLVFGCQVEDEEDDLPPWEISPVMPVEAPVEDTTTYVPVEVVEEVVGVPSTVSGAFSMSMVELAPKKEKVPSKKELKCLEEVKQITELKGILKEVLDGTYDNSEVPTHAVMTRFRATTWYKQQLMEQSKLFVQLENEDREEEFSWKTMDQLMTEFLNGH